VKKIILATIASLLVTTANAQELLCETTSNNRQHNSEAGNQLKVVGLLANGTVMEIYEAADGTFGVLISGTDGITCLLTTGSFLEINYPKPRKNPNL
jgi:cytochrome c-type biogenesis protein CcmE